MLTKPARRRGFTLIEILVVISLIAVLAALSVGALFRVRAAQQTSNTEGTLGKLDTLLMARWSAVLVNAKTPPDGVIAFCDGDKERAVSLWTYAVLKNEFPVSYAELTAITNIGTTLQPRAVFKKVQTTAPSASLTEQSAALFYAAIMDTGTRGTANSLEGLQQQVATTTNGLSVFNDNWGIPIVFIRDASNAEIQAAPHSKPSAKGSYNPLDPRLLLQGWTKESTAASAIGLPGNKFQIVNFIPTLVSAGPDKVFSNQALANPTAPDFSTFLGGAAGDSSNDNLLSYRRREGTRRD